MMNHRHKGTVARRGEHILSDRRIGKLLLRLSIPAVIGMTMQATYNVVDRIFVGMVVGDLGISGITVVFPIQVFVLALGFLVGIGSASIVSRSLGAENQKRADRTLGNMYINVLVLGALIGTFGRIYMRPLLDIFGGTEDNLSYAMEYGNIIVTGNLFFVLIVASNNMIRSEGRARIAMGSMLVSAGLNVVLDALFILVFDMGVAGAALATVLAQAATAAYVLYWFLSGRSALRLHWRDMIPDFSIIKEMYAIGSSAFFRQSTASILFIILNNAIRRFGDAHSLASLGIVHSITMLMLMPIFGIGQGMQPVVGFNYGAGRYGLTKRAVILAASAASVITTIGYLILLLLPEQLTRLFTDNPNLIDETVRFTRMLALMFPFIGFQIMGTVMFQAIGKPGWSLLLSMARQALLLLPLVLILPEFLGLYGIWLSFPLADFVATALTVAVVIPQLRRFSRMESSDNNTKEPVPEGESS